MKCKTIRADLEINSATPDVAQSEIRVVKRSGKLKKIRFWKLGAIIDDPQCFRLVQLGVAVPADDECTEAANMTPEQMKAAEHGANRAAAGIHPDDYKLFDRGVILGYNGDGSYKLGPNGHELEEVEEVDDDGEDSLSDSE